MTGRARILVTGGAGFIASHACKALAAEGYLPVTIDNLSTGNRDAVKWGPLILGDIRDTALVRDILLSNDIKAVLHFAASAYVGESMTDPALYYDNNVGGMISLLAGCQQAGVSRIVFSSSCATYGIPDSLPITESAAQTPINPYGRTKLIGEQMIRDHGAAYGLNHVILRYFNAAGADPEGELRERHDPETHLIPLALLAASGQRPGLQIFGNDYPTPDGTCIRDYIHVTDLARAHVNALSHLMGGGPDLAVNLGTGKGLSILQIVAAAERACGRRVPVTFSSRRPGDPPVLLADPARAARELGFTTRLSDIDTIMRHAAVGFGLEATNAAFA